MDTSKCWNTRNLIAKFSKVLCFWGCRQYQKRSEDFRRPMCKAACCDKGFDLGLVSWKVCPGIIRSILYQSLPNFIIKTPMIYLYKRPYIKSYRLFLFQLSNCEEIVHYGKVSALLRLTSTDHVTYGCHWTRHVKQKMLNI